RLAGVETTNGCTVVATAKTIEGTVPPWSRVFVFDSSYIPYIDSGAGFGTAADNRGNFQFNTPPGKYVIFVIGPAGDAAGIAITSPDSGKTGSVSKQQQLQLPGVVSGTVVTAASDTMLVFLEGMCQYQVLVTAGAFSLGSVPPGTYVLKVARISGSLIGIGLTILHEQRIQVNPGSVTPLTPIRF
ncbi:MAG TPA: hypothetical protein VF335_08180, partial [Chitinivibrionales bacterium]